MVFSSKILCCNILSLYISLVDYFFLQIRFLYNSLAQNKKESDNKELRNQIDKLENETNELRKQLQDANEAKNSAIQLSADKKNLEEDLKKKEEKLKELTDAADVAKESTFSFFFEHC